ncbi:MAG: DEAD/DEAH box helicase, partial [Clostridia bacterium]
AALFAFKSPFSKGAILADEVGLGKTIEAGLVLSENWAEHKRKILIIVPSSLRKQWSAELVDKFYLPSIILESKSFNENIKQSNFNPFLQSDIVICSYQFAKSKIDYVKAVEWDLIVIDEAHRLRNAYRVDNKTARCLKDNLAAFKKLLLTATPLQNSLLELYSLVSFIDGNVFGDLVSYKQNYMRGELTTSDFADLKKRIKPVVYRTLRRQVLEYVKYTNRIAITQEFEPNADEQLLYESISNYLMQDKLMALPNSQRTLITLIMRKLLASSSFAITDTLKSLIARLQKYYAELTGSTIEETECSSLADEDFAEIYIEENDEDEIEAENELFGDFGILNDDEKE